MISETAETSYLERDSGIQSPAQATIEVVRALSNAAEELERLRSRYEEAKAAFEEAEANYDAFRRITLPNMMMDSGVTSLMTTSGVRCELVTKYHCSPNKNPEDQRIMSEWLRKHGAGDMVKEYEVVNAAYVQQLAAMQIPYTEKSEVNTNTLKAWLKDQTGGNGGFENIKFEDIPDCIHFVRLPEVVIK